MEYKSSAVLGNMLSEMYADKTFADVSFISQKDGGKVFAHRCMLSNVSNVLREKFNQTSLNNSIIVEEPSCAIDSVMKFLYGKSNIPQKDMVDAIQFANNYQIEEVKTFCMDNVEIHRDNFYALCLNSRYGNNVLKARLCHFLKENFDDLDVNTLSSIPKDILQEIGSAEI